MGLHASCIMGGGCMLPSINDLQSPGTCVLWRRDSHPHTCDLPSLDVNTSDSLGSLPSASSSSQTSFFRLSSPRATLLLEWEDCACE